MLLGRLRKEHEPFVQAWVCNSIVLGRNMTWFETSSYQSIQNAPMYGYLDIYMRISKNLDLLHQAKAKRSMLSAWRQRQKAPNTCLQRL